MRTIIHVDMDCFYAAIEVRDRPALRGKAVAVGGARDRRGVLTTCNYEARRFGVRSAMPTFMALEKCPHLVVVPTRFDVYREESERIREIFFEYTDLVEPLSLDEAYLDVSGDPRGGAYLAEAIRKRIRESRGLTASAGIGPNKLIAKIASDWEKPDGQFEVCEGDVEAFMFSLPARKLWGIGPVAAARLDRLGIKTCGDLRVLDPVRLHELFGRFGYELHEMAKGIDLREVEPDRLRKSLSTEKTYSEDLAGVAACLEALPPLLSELEQDLAAKERGRPVDRLFVKLKFSDFSQTTVERAGATVDADVYGKLIEEGWRRGAKPVRLLGVGVRFRETPRAEQLHFNFGDPRGQESSGRLLT